MSRPAKPIQSVLLLHFFSFSKLQGSPNYFIYSFKEVLWGKIRNQVGKRWCCSCVSLPFTLT